MMLTVVLIGVILDCCAFVIAARLATLVFDAAPVPRQRRRCIRCGGWLDAAAEASDSARTPRRSCGQGVRGLGGE